MLAFDTTSPGQSAGLERAQIKYETLDFQRDNSVATVRLTNPAAGNRIDAETAAELKELCAAVSQDEGIRLLIVAGSGGVFSLGRTSPPPDLLAQGGADLAGWLSRMQVASAVAELSIPVVAMVEGDAFDHGMELALAADLRIASEEARFALNDLANGVFPWDGGTQRLPRLVGPGRASDMILTGRVVPAAEALKIGLVNRVFAKEELWPQADKLVENIVAGAPIAAGYAKEAVKKGLDVTLAQGLRLEADLNMLLYETDDRAEGINSFLERRRPEFRGE